MFYPTCITESEASICMTLVRQEITTIFLNSSPTYIKSYQNYKTSVSATEISCLIKHSFVTFTYFETNKHSSTQITLINRIYRYYEII